MKLCYSKTLLVLIIVLLMMKRAAFDMLLDVGYRQFTLLLITCYFDE
jgi:hypothetical protein